MDNSSLLQEQKASVWKRPAENSSKVGWIAFMPEKIGLKRHCRNRESRRNIDD
jgi:hypothetical protein